MLAARILLRGEGEGQARLLHSLGSVKGRVRFPLDRAGRHRTGSVGRIDACLPEMIVDNLPAPITMHREIGPQRMQGMRGWARGRGRGRLVDTARYRTNGFMTACLETGPEGAPAVMLSHSHFSDHRMWHPQIDALAARYRVVAYDTRGHGASGVPKGPYSLDDLAGDALELIDALGLGEVHFIGLSMGGMIGMTLALKAPGRLRSLLLCDTAAEMPAGVWDERIATARAQGIEPLLEPTMARWFTPEFRASSPETIAWIRGIASGTATEGYIACAEAIKAMRLVPRLGDIRVPARVIVGAQDPATPVAAADVLAQGIPGADLVVVDGAAHLANLEQPAPFTAAMLEFLDAQAAPDAQQQGASGSSRLAPQADGELR